MIRCKNCEKEINNEDKFCRSCGMEALAENTVEVNEQALTDEREDIIDEPTTYIIDKRKNELKVILLLIIALIALGFGFYIKNRIVLRQVLAVEAFNQNIVTSDDKII